MRALLLFLVLLTAAMPAMADPPDEPFPMPEDVLRPRTEAGITFFGEVGLGLNYTMLSADPTYRQVYPYEGASDLYSSTSGIGGFSYAAIGVNLSPMFSVAIREDYDIKRTSSSETILDTGTRSDPRGTREVEKTSEVSITYSVFSLLGEVHFDDFHIFAGPSFGFGLERELTETQTNLTSGETFFQGSGNEATTITGTLSETTRENLAMRIAIKIGVGYSYQIAPKYEIVPRLNYELGLTGALEEDEMMTLGGPTGGENLPVFIDKDFKLSAIQFSVGIRFTP